MGNSPKELRGAIDALAKQLHSLDNAVRQQVNEFHKLLKDAPWKHEPLGDGPRENPDGERESAPPQATPANDRPGDRPHRTDNRRNDRPQWWIRMWVWEPWKRGLSVAAGLATVGYAVITWHQWRDLRHNFQVDQRPWIDITDFRPMDKWYWNATAGTFIVNMSFTLRNTGKTPAIDVAILQDFFPDMAHVNIAAKQSATCVGTRLPGAVVFPGVEGEKRFPFQARISERLMDALPLFPSGRPIEYIRPVLLGCVSYRSKLSDDMLSTGFVYEMRYTPDGGKTSSQMKRNREEIPASSLQMFEQSFYGDNRLTK
jgi:hypothetical protein